MSKIRAGFAYFWTHHVQKTFGSLLLGTGLYDEAADLYTSFVNYAPELGDLIGHAWYRRVRIALVVVMVARAIVKPKPPQ